MLTWNNQKATGQGLESLAEAGSSKSVEISRASRSWQLALRKVPVIFQIAFQLRLCCLCGLVAPQPHLELRLLSRAGWRAVESLPEAGEDLSLAFLCSSYLLFANTCGSEVLVSRLVWRC